MRNRTVAVLAVSTLWAGNYNRAFGSRKGCLIPASIAPTAMPAGPDKFRPAIPLVSQFLNEYIGDALGRVSVP